MVNTVLLCPPDDYRIEYEINPWMHMENQVDQTKVRQEYESLAAIYKKLGLQVDVIDPQPGLPDMVYTANHGFVIDNIFIKANFRYPQRRKESDHAVEFFQKKGYTIKTLPDDVFFEGQGDLFYADGKFFFGHGKRSSKQAKNYLEEILGDELIDFQVNNPYYYHLDTCFAPLGKGRAVINPASFSKEDVRKIKKNFKTVIETDAKDNMHLCCNLVKNHAAVVVAQGISHDLRRSIEKTGYEVIETPTKEYLKGGGSVKCLTLEFFES